MSFSRFKREAKDSIAFNDGKSFADVILVSKERKYFLAHKVMLVRV